MDTESEDELFEFHLAELVQARYEGREMRRLLVRGQRLGVAPRLADHQHVLTRRALENIVRYAAPPVPWPYLPLPRGWNPSYG
mgnify:CR=1 FL=1